MKMHTLVEMLQYHLQSDGRPPLHIAPLTQEELGTQSAFGCLTGLTDKLTPMDDFKYEANARPAANCENPLGADKIVVFFSFSGMADVVHSMLTAYGIQSLVCNGRTKAADWQKILQAFDESTRDGPRVLLLSKVGAEGLNLVMPHILVVLVKPFGHSTLCTSDHLTGCPLV